jgi:putative iron-dependent peroxidase
MSAADKAKAQPSIIAQSPPAGRSITFRLVPDLDFRSALGRLRDGLPLDAGVVGLGEPVVRALGKNVPGLVTFPALSGAEIAVPSTQQALWLFLRGADKGVLFDVTVKVRTALAPAFEMHDLMDTFVYAGGRDLTGYETAPRIQRETRRRMRRSRRALRVLPDRVSSRCSVGRTT